MDELKRSIDRLIKVVITTTFIIVTFFSELYMVYSIDNLKVLIFVALLWVINISLVIGMYKIK